MKASQRHGMLEAMVIAGLMSVAGCSDPSSDGGASGDAGGPLDAALARISRDNIASTLNYLAADERKGRSTGTEEYDASARYVADELAAAGLMPGGADGWYQPVPFITRMIDPERSGVTLHKDGRDIDLAWKRDLYIVADPLRPTNHVRAEVVFVGFGVHAPELGYSDYQGIDVNGKIVATFVGAPATFPPTQRAHYSDDRTKTEALLSRGAIGQIDLRNRAEEARESWEEVTRNIGTQPGMSWIDASGEIADYHPALEGYSLLSRSAAEQLFEGAPLTFEEALDASDAARPSSMALGVEVTMYRQASHERITSANVIGILPGSDPVLAQEYIVFTSHLDHIGTGEPVDGDDIYNGMYDNALGVAMLLEAARVLAALPVAPRRSIAFVALTGEEEGLLGSDYFAQYPTVPRAAIVANLNIDMPLVLFPMRTITGYGAEHSSLEAVTAAAVEPEGFELAPDPFPEEVNFIRSDQYSFVRHGIPSVYLAEGLVSADPELNGREVVEAFLHEHYHQPSDDLSLPIDWDSALRFARASTRLVYRMAMDEQRPTWNEGDFFGARFGER